MIAPMYPDSSEKLHQVVMLIIKQILLTSWQHEEFKAHLLAPYLLKFNAALLQVTLKLDRNHIVDCCS